jgi:A1 cistron-splicing factor AAR2
MHLHIKILIFFGHVLRIELTLSRVGSKAEERNQRRSLPEFVDKLQPYSLSTPDIGGKKAPKDSTLEQEVWRSLTSCMKGAFLSRVTGKTWNHWPISSGHDCKRDRDISLDPHSKIDERKDEVLMFVFPKDTRTFSSESSGRERTEQAIDTTSHITAVISRCTYEDSDEIIGELQFCFVTGMILGNAACQEHWAHIVRTVFRAFRLAAELPAFFEKFIRAFHAQLMYDEKGLEGGSILDIESSLRDDLKVILTIFKSRLTEQLLAQGNQLTDKQKAVGDVFDALEARLWNWGWDLRGHYLRKGNYQLEDGTLIEDLEVTELEGEDERGEYAPQIVAVDEQGREIGLIRF